MLYASILFSAHLNFINLFINNINSYIYISNYNIHDIILMIKSFDLKSIIKYIKKNIIINKYI